MTCFLAKVANRAKNAKMNFFAPLAFLRSLRENKLRSVKFLVYRLLMQKEISRCVFLCVRRK